jgi:BirA family biotin operon repressor/biotin-[acetyl-CoA-carboxylase] ligase
MIVTNNIEFAQRYFGQLKNWNEINNDVLPTYSQKLLEHSGLLYKCESLIDLEFNSDIFGHIFLIDYAEHSQYDLLIRIAKETNIDENIICIAGSGKKFHGFRNRHWESLQGNIHLSAYFKPNKKIKNYGIGFLILSAVSVVMAIDEINGLKNKAKIKWVNDILIGNAKVCGVLAHSFAQGDIVTDAILGIGLNVEQTPKIEPTIFVPESACLNDYLENTNKTNESEVFRNLLKHLSNNYNTLISGGYDELLKFYIDRSAIINKIVSIWSDGRDGTNELLRKGKVLKIGENLELYLDDSPNPVFDGRLAMEDKI